MADLERGQMILITAFVLAVTFIGLALVVNSAIFSENLASRGETSGSSDTLHMGDEVKTGVGKVVEYANVHNESSYGSNSHESLAVSVTHATENISTWIGQQHAASGRVIELRVVSQTNGTRIADNSSGGSQFLSATGDETWTLLYNGKFTLKDEDTTVAGTDIINESPDDDVADVRAFRINTTSVSGDAFDDAMCDSGDEFCINVTDADNTGSGPDSWLMNVSKDASGDVIVGVQNASGNQMVCSTTESEPVIDVTSGRIDGQPCYALRKMPFGDGVTPEYMINISNGDEITGNYSLVINRSTEPAAARDFFTDADTSGVLDPADKPLDINTTTTNPTIDTGQPFARPAIYNLTVEVQYTMTSAKHELRVRVAPGEPNE